VEAGDVAGDIEEVLHGNSHRSSSPLTRAHTIRGIGFCWKENGR